MYCHGGSDSTYVPAQYDERFLLESSILVIDNDNVIRLDDLDEDFTYIAQLWNSPLCSYASSR